MFRVMSKVKILSPADNPGSPKTISMLWIIKSGLLKVCDSDWLSCFSGKKKLSLYISVFLKAQMLIKYLSNRRVSLEILSSTICEKAK